jgi:hypothetical protein
MDWKLIFGLSLFGLAMGVATVFVIRFGCRACLLVVHLPGMRIPHRAKAAGPTFSSRFAARHCEWRLGYRRAYRLLFSVHRESSERGCDDGFDAPSELAAFDDGVHRPNHRHNFWSHYWYVGLCGRKTGQAASQ